MEKHVESKYFFPKFGHFYLQLPPFSIIADFLPFKNILYPAFNFFLK